MSSISARELREHYNRDAARSRAGVDYLEIATNLARAQVSRLQAVETGRHTHWATFDSPKYHNGYQLASCGDVVRLTLFSTTPSCPACRQQLAIFESLEF